MAWDLMLHITTISGIKVIFMFYRKYLLHLLFDFWVCELFHNITHYVFLSFCFHTYFTPGYLIGNLQIQFYDSAILPLLVSWYDSSKRRNVLEIIWLTLSFILVCKDDMPVIEPRLTVCIASAVPTVLISEAQVNDLFSHLSGWEWGFGKMQWWSSSSGCVGGSLTVWGDWGLPAFKTSH